MITRYLSQVRRFCSCVKNTEIMKYLCVAEKNDAAKTISGFLSRGASQRREGISQYNKIYEFDMDFRGQKARIVFTSVSGHLLTFEFSNAYRNWQSCNPEQLFDAPVVKNCPENYQKIKMTLEREARTCNGLIIWTDCDREGENIGYEIINVCKAIKPNITVERAKFSDMTAASIHRAMNNLILPDERVSNAVDVRSELDLRIGAAFTRFQTMRFKNAFPANIEGIVSYGSCQFPTLGFVAQRYKEIENFVARIFWKIKLTHKIGKLTVEFSWARNRLFDKPCTESILMICQAARQATITNVQQKPKSKWRPLPMDTVELEKTGSRKLKLTAKKIMTIAEKLYTQGHISYPRTETNKFPKDMNLRNLVEIQTPHPDWGEFAGRVLEWGPNPRSGNKSDQAHPPIHPTKFVTTLQGDEKRVYELVVRHFLACVSRDAVGSETIVNATIGNEDFTATGLVILERNYLDVYVYDRWSGKEIHHYEVNQIFTPTELCLHEGSTNPPAMLTEADLIGLMEKHGIGTDATHAEHISTIKERGYIGELDQGHLVPGTLGMGLVEGYELMNLQLAQPKLRAGLEEDLKGICNGVKNPQAVLAEQIQKYKECYQIVTREAVTLDQALGQRFGQAPQLAQPEIAPIREMFKCPKCRETTMIIKQKRDNSGHFISCQGYPNCKNVAWLPNSVKDITSVDEMCGNCGGENRKVKIKFNPISTLGLVREAPAYSRIDGTHYITCIICDDSLRQILEIPLEKVKILGNIVGGSTGPIQQNVPRNPVARDPPVRGFSTSANPGNRPDQNQRGGWYSNDDDDNDHGGGGGAVAVAANTNRNQGWNNNSSATIGNPYRNQLNNNSSNQWGSNSNVPNNNPGVQRNNNPVNQWGSNSSVSNNNPGFQRNNNPNNQWGSNSSVSNNNPGFQRNNNPNNQWSSNSSVSNNNPGFQRNNNPNTTILTKKPAVNLSKLANINCKCNVKAGKLITKQGANIGRPFYNCATRKCNFFQWADVPLPGNLQPIAATSGGTGAKRKCGICRQEGHNKKNCPNSGQA